MIQAVRAPGGHGQLSTVVSTPSNAHRARGSGAGAPRRAAPASGAHHLHCPAMCRSEARLG
eukprot:CAMPEP_0206005600 /NCGR_PEP_ID=MMETSP1464-20131121/4674_1 /ASSEMBLY_ACC=CAM_ASM_001124 /TAXON_ID=119497 /ORGANISM="Exanthemachrysis gayraliae, Strain RCC1523" /LENGTH=60 /DNA_ID=CAMNT_0053379045 /DNA_START=33 /DNA_END=213 /DNA_ORIENTATION=-